MPLGRIFQITSDLIKFHSVKTGNAPVLLTSVDSTSLSVDSLFGLTF